MGCAGVWELPGSGLGTCPRCNAGSDGLQAESEPGVWDSIPSQNLWLIPVSPRALTRALATGKDLGTHGDLKEHQIYLLSYL